MAHHGIVHRRDHAATANVGSWQAGDDWHGSQVGEHTPADAGAGLGVFEHLHDFAHPGEFADHLRDAAKRVYGTPARAFLERLVDMRQDDPDGLYRRLKQSRATSSSSTCQPVPMDRSSAQDASVWLPVRARWRSPPISCPERREKQNAPVRAASTIGWPRVAPRVQGEKQNGIRAVQLFLELHGSRFRDINVMPRYPTTHGQRSMVDETEEAQAQLDERSINNQAGYKQYDGEKTVQST